MGGTETTGIRVRVAVESAEACPVARATDTDSTARSVTWSTAPDGDVVEEFDLVGDPDDGQLPEDATVVFDAEDRKRVRFERDDDGCICDLVERVGAPVTDVTASHGTLRLTFHATGVETVRTVIGELTDAYESVRLDQLSHTGDDGVEDFVLVDRGELTDRQQEVLETALDMGYFQRPRDANATEVADALDIAPSTFAEHLASAQSKVIGSLLNGSA
jgi:predicted DNA binding protein